MPPLHERLRPYLERLFSLVNDTVHIATLVGTTVHHNDCIVATDQALILTSRNGKRLPGRLASSGKAMLADLAPQVVNARYAPTDQNTMPQAIALNLQDLHDEFEKVHRQGSQLMLSQLVRAHGAYRLIRSRGWGTYGPER